MEWREEYWILSIYAFVKSTTGNGQESYFNWLLIVGLCDLVLLSFGLLFAIWHVKRGENVLVNHP